MQTNLLGIWEDYTVVCCHLTFHAWLVGHHVFCLVWEDARERRAITLFSNTSRGGKQGWTMGWSDTVWQQGGGKPQLVDVGQTPPMRTNCSADSAWSPVSDAQLCRTGGLNIKTQSLLRNSDSHNFQSLSCSACVLQRLLKWCPFRGLYDQNIKNRQTGNGAGCIWDTLTLLLYQMLWYIYIFYWQIDTFFSLALDS